MEEPLKLVWERLEQKVERNWFHYRCQLVGHKIYIQGGYARTIRLPGIIHIFDIVEEKWAEKNISGNLPPSVVGTRMVLAGDKLFNIGCAQGKKMAVIYAVDIVALQWTAREMAGEHLGLYTYHASSFWQKRGCAVSNAAGLGQDNEFNFTYFIDLNTCVARRVETKGPAPSTRQHHSSIILEQRSKFFVYGGSRLRYNVAMASLRPIYILDLSEVVHPTWTSILPTYPRVGYRNSSLVYIHDRLLIVGGYFLKQEADPVLEFDANGKYIGPTEMEGSGRPSVADLHFQQVVQTPSQLYMFCAASGSILRATWHSLPSKYVL